MYSDNLGFSLDEYTSSVKTEWILNKLKEMANDYAENQKKKGKVNNSHGKHFCSKNLSEILEFVMKSEEV